MQLEVTETHILKGVRRSISKCPIALAFEEKLGAKVMVSHGDVFCLHYHSHYRLGPAAKYFVAEFDRGKTVKPFTCEAERVLVPFVRMSGDSHGTMLDKDGNLINHLM